MRALLERRPGVATAILAGGVNRPRHPTKGFSELADDRLEAFARSRNVTGDHVAFTLGLIELLGCEAHYFGAERHRPRRRILDCSAERVQSRALEADGIRVPVAA
ncbi:MAG: hypothetical protein OXG17_08075 [Chloroflexi bacterium]|nr:hypothetical protein [Chloroflexota bacterium]